MSNTLVRDAVRAAIGVGVAATLAASPNAFAQEEDPAQLGRIITTGTRISRLDIEAARPITIISREDIEFESKNFTCRYCTADDTVDERGNDKGGGGIKTPLKRHAGCIRITISFDKGANFHLELAAAGIGEET